MIYWGLGFPTISPNITEGSAMKDKKFLDNINPERREFLEKVTKGAFIIPTVISVMMLNQKLNLTTANAQSNVVVM